MESVFILVFWLSIGPLRFDNILACVMISHLRLAAIPLCVCVNMLCIWSSARCLGHLYQKWNYYIMWFYVDTWGNILPFSTTAILQSHQQWTNVPVSPHPCFHLLFWVYGIAIPKAFPLQCHWACSPVFTGFEEMTVKMIVHFTIRFCCVVVLMCPRDQSLVK